MALDFAKPLQGFHDKKKSVRSIRSLVRADFRHLSTLVCSMSIGMAPPTAMDWTGPDFPNRRRAEPSPGTVSRSTLLPSPNASYSVTNASAGVKIRPFPKASKLVLTANVLVRLDSGGLRAKPAPLVGLGYTF